MSREERNMDFKKLAEKRYSCRKFADRKVDDSLVEQIIETANKAPTAVNIQPIKIFWMKSNEAKEAIKQVYSNTFGADTFLVVGYQNDAGWVRSFDGRSFADVDGSIVATHVMLQIADLGLATTWVGHFNAPLLKQLYPDMENYELIALFPVGYAAEDAEPDPRHFKRKATNEIVTVL